MNRWDENHPRSPARVWRLRRLRRYGQDAGGDEDRDHPDGSALAVTVPFDLIAENNDPTRIRKISGAAKPRPELGMRGRYQLRLLAERSRFYSANPNLRILVDRALVVPTGRTDENGRAEWAITDAGRMVLAEVEP